MTGAMSCQIPLAVMAKAALIAIADATAPTANNLHRPRKRFLRLHPRG
jgi:hypothetical protein